MSDPALERTSRRALLTGGVAGLAALVANAVLRPEPVAAAAGGTMILGGSLATNSSGASDTNLTSTNGNQTLFVTNDTTGISVKAHAWQGPGIDAYSFYATAVVAEARSDDQISVHGLKTVGIGPAVKGENKVSSNGYAAVYGVTNGTGPAVYGKAWQPETELRASLREPGQASTGGPTMVAAVDSQARRPRSASTRRRP